MELIGEGRALHVCDACGGVDDHSRHSFVGMANPGADQETYPPPNLEVVQSVMDLIRDFDHDTGSRLLADLMDRTITDRHRDCCRAAGCPSGECDYIAELGGGDLRGAELVAFIETHGEDIRQKFMPTEAAE